MYPNRADRKPTTTRRRRRRAGSWSCSCWPLRESDTCSTPANAAKSKLETDLAQAKSKEAILSVQIDQTNSRVADLKGQLEVTTQKLGFTQAELAQARALAQNIRQTQKDSDEKLTAQIGQVKQDTDAKIGAVSTDLTGAKSDISATKQDLEATKAKLTSTVGDLGVQSGLIARNQEELDQLKRSGERNIFELHLTKSKTPTHVGPIQVTLTKTDPKKFKYTLMVVADDKTIEKKDKTADEPVQFYIKGATHPVRNRGFRRDQRQSERLSFDAQGHRHGARSELTR